MSEPARASSRWRRRGPVPPAWWRSTSTRTPRGPRSTTHTPTASTEASTAVCSEPALGAGAPPAIRRDPVEPALFPRGAARPRRPRLERGSRIPRHRATVRAGARPTGTGGHDVSSDFVGVGLRAARRSHRAGGLSGAAGARALDPDRVTADLRAAPEIGRWSAPGKPVQETTDAPHRGSQRIARLRYASRPGGGRRGRELRHRTIGIRLSRRPLGLRQDDAAQHHRRLSRADAPARSASAAEPINGPRHGPRHRVPGFRPAVPLAHRARQRDLRAGDEGGRQGRARARSRASNSSW